MLFYRNFKYETGSDTTGGGGGSSASSDGSNTGGGTATPPDKTGADGAGGTLTQETVDSLIGKTRTETRVKATQEATNEILKKGEFESLDDMLSYLKKARERDQAELSDLEKTQAQLEAEKKAREEAAAELEQMRQSLRKNQVRSAISLAAKDAVKVDQVLTILTADIEYDDYLTESGEADQKKVEALVKKFKGDNPHFFTTGLPGSPSNHGGSAFKPEDIKVKVPRL